MPYDMVGKPVFPTDWPVPIYWTADPDLTIPHVYFKLPTGGDGAPGVYLGFNDAGSWLHSFDGKTYVWNLKTHKATLAGGLIQDLPTSVLVSLRNSAVVGLLPGRGIPVNGPELDPNVPPTYNPTMGINDTVIWGYEYGGSIPTVTILRAPCTYLGFNGRGTWVKDEWDGKIYIWNIASQSVVPAAGNQNEVPLDLKNQSLTMQGIVAHLRAHPGGSSMHVVASPSAQEDPNLADDKASHDAVPFAYDYAAGAGTVPAILFRVPASTGIYLGFNERGSWVRDVWDGNTYVWDGSRKFFSVGTSDDRNLPPRLKNPSPQLATLIARAGAHTPANAVKEQTATSLALPSPDAYGSSTQVRGSKVSITGGVLKFTLDERSSPDNGKQVSYKVTRSNGPAMPPGVPGAPAASAIAGTWIADDPNNKDGIVMFIVQDENAVAGTVFHGLAAQAMKKIALGGH